MKKNVFQVLVNAREYYDRKLGNLAHLVGDAPNRVSSRYQILIHSLIANILRLFLRSYSMRELYLNLLEWEIQRGILAESSPLTPKKVREDKFYMARSLLTAVHRGLSNGMISGDVMSKFLLPFSHALSQNRKKIEKFKGKYGINPPCFVTISPTKFCNLHCVGCYANSDCQSKNTLEYEVVSNIVREQKDLWGSHFTVISGGEPLLYESKGKTIFDLAKEHRDTLFLMYTNGTLIDKKIASKFAEVGNITPAISVEGYEKETDARRGKGVHKKILSAFECLKEVGVPFGISVTGTKLNAEILSGDTFYDYYLNQKGALYCWIFQYMPIGRKYTLDLMVTPQQRVAMYRKAWQMVREKHLFVADFWNSGTASMGCISGGREGGYFYIDWNGNVMPCVFNPYTTHNILDVYNKGGNLNSVLFSPFFKEVRKWQDDYLYKQKNNKMGNLLVPCPIRDHHKEMLEIIRKTDAKPTDLPSEEALNDPAYHQGLAEYDDKIGHLFGSIWEEEYIKN